MEARYSRHGLSLNFFVTNGKKRSRSLLNLLESIIIILFGNPNPFFIYNFPIPDFTFLKLSLQFLCIFNY